MKSRIGRRFEGRIQGFSLKVAFVRLESPFVEVGVPLGALGGTFDVDQHRTKATGMSGQVVLSIGDKVKVEITGVDEDLRRVSAWVVEAQAQDGKGKVMTFVPSLAAPATLREADFVKERNPRFEGRHRDEAARPPKGRPPRAVREGQRQDSRTSDSRTSDSRTSGSRTSGSRTSGSRPSSGRTPDGRPAQRPGRAKPPKGSVRGGGKKN
jgi:hypothetical protein